MGAVVLMATAHAQSNQPLTKAQAEQKIYEIKDVKEVCTKSKRFDTETERTAWINAVKKSYLVTNVEEYPDNGPGGPDVWYPWATVTYVAANCRTAVLPSIQEVPIVRYNILENECYGSESEATEAYNSAHAVQKNCHFISEEDSGVYFTPCPYAGCPTWCYVIKGW